MTPQEPELDENGEPIVDEFTSDLSHGITVEYFDKVDQASSILLNFSASILPIRVCTWRFVSASILGAVRITMTSS